MLETDFSSKFPRDYKHRPILLAYPPPVLPVEDEATQYQDCQSYKAYGQGQDGVGHCVETQPQRDGGQ